MRRLLIPTLLCVTMLGCGGGTATEETSSDTTTESGTPEAAGGASATGYDTPEDVYAAVRSAVEAKDWKKVASLMSPESQAMLAGMSIMSSSFATITAEGEEDEAKAKELKELLAKHGVDLDDDEEPSEEELAAGPEAMMMSMTKSIPDLPVFIAEINEWMENNTDDGGGGFAELGDLSEVTVEGDTAKAVSKTEFGDQPIEFRKSGDGWVVHLPIGGPPQ